MKNTIRCAGCGKEIDPAGGYYNTPRGPFCAPCWECKPAYVRNDALREAIMKKIESVIKK